MNLIDELDGEKTTPRKHGTVVVACRHTSTTYHTRKPVVYVESTLSMQCRCWATNCSMRTTVRRVVKFGDGS
jgi:hypothetical protein